MNRSVLPTESPEALRSFVKGRDLFQTYLASGRGAELDQAKACFTRATSIDPVFDLAGFYLAMANNELRDHDAAIAQLRPLASRLGEFLPEIHLQLAYAHIKKYETESYFVADQLLDETVRAAHKARRKEMELLAGAMRVFLYSVMGGRLRRDDKEQQTKERDQYTEKAINLGNELLDQRTAKGQAAEVARFEIRNGLGIAYLRKGDAAEPFSPEQDRLWLQSEEHLRQALVLKPNSVRALQNVGTLRKLQGDHLRRAGSRQEALRRYEEAREAYLQSIELNPLDQFPHYRMAELSVRVAELGDRPEEWVRALEFCEMGRRQKGSVKDESWARVLRAIEEMNPDILDEK